jgi:hypothetical protein
MIRSQVPSKPLSARAVVALIGLAGCGEVEKLRPPGDGAIDGADAADTAAHLVFVTSTVITGEMPPLGGLAGADALCMARAVAAGLPGTYLAWLAAGPVTPASRMVRHAGPYQLTTGVIIAQGWADLTDGNIAEKIDRTETQAMSQGNFVCRGGEVWSNVDGAGNARAGQGDCADWTSQMATGTAGNVTSKDVMWTAGDCTAIACSTGMPIYCVQQ